MNKFYTGYDKFLVAVDCIIFGFDEGELKLLLIKRNFRKKILSFDVLKKFNEKEKKRSKKGAYLYRFDRDKYKRLIENGYSFEVNV
jgi:hypothetical protein